MKIEQKYWNRECGWRNVGKSNAVTEPQVVIYFSSPGAMNAEECFSEIRKHYPEGHLLGCTTGLGRLFPMRCLTIRLL